jgi:hypothetical protein
MQFLVDERHQAIERCSVAPLPFAEQPRDVCQREGPVVVNLRAGAIGRRRTAGVLLGPEAVAWIDACGPSRRYVDRTRSRAR